MAQELLLSVQDALITFGKQPLFEELSFNIHSGDNISLVGKNGAGKSTLMQVITGTRELDGGKRWENPGLRIGYLQQEVIPQKNQTVHEFIFNGLPKDKQNDDYLYMVEMMLTPFELKAQAQMTHLSGGQMRRASLARALVEEPDILLLDEPTNHLDLGGIEWLENYLKSYRGTLICVSHDKRFLANISNKIFWLDRGQVRVCPKGFGHFDEWSTELLDLEARELENREKAVAQEVAWASKGIKARRKRNVRRVEEMQKARDKLKSDKSAYRKIMSKVELEPLPDSHVSKVVAEFIKVRKCFNNEHGETPILDQFNLRIMKGDRIGILGKNGSGKTTFLKLLIQEMEPDAGKVKLAKTAEIAYFDQKREDLKHDDTLKKNLCPTGGDYIDVNGTPRHVCGYLKDFLFDPKSVNDRVSTLSGGQRNRLMLAKILANPGNFLILDEPTNDLDMDTLEMLEEILSKYQGTLFIVSHDRDFLDQTVSRILAFEGDAEVRGYIGGYSDYLESVKKNNPSKKIQKQTEKQQAQTINEPKQNKQLSYKYQRELDGLPAKMQKLEKEIATLQALMADPTLYTNDPEKFEKTARQIPRKEKQLEDLEERWLEIEAMKED